MGKTCSGISKCSCYISTFLFFRFNKNIQNQPFSPTQFKLHIIHYYLWFLVVSFYLFNFFHFQSYSVIVCFAGLLEKTLRKMRCFFSILILFFFHQIQNVKKITQVQQCVIVQIQMESVKVQNRLCAHPYFEKKEKGRKGEEKERGGRGQEI